jgi:hypothetical protein
VEALAATDGHVRDTDMKITKAQIGKAGELLVQQKFLLYGIESAPLTTDSGIDLVAYSPRKQEAITIQVKTNLKAKPGGGKGRLSIDWWAPQNSPADLFAFVDLERNRVWLIKTIELASLAQQKPEGRYHFFMAVDPMAKTRRDGKLFHDYEFENYLLENRIHKLF